MTDDELKTEALTLARTRWNQMTGETDQHLPLDWWQGVELGYIAGSKSRDMEIEQLYAVIKDRNEQITSLNEKRMMDLDADVLQEYFNE
jgi:hypothetical protein